MKLFLDDEWDLPERYPGDDWICIRNVVEAKEILVENKGKVTHLSLDNDLGETQLEGNSLTNWLAEEWFVNGNDFWPTEVVSIHSRNSQGRKLMEMDIKNERYNPRTWMLKPVLI